MRATQLRLLLILCAQDAAHGAEELSVCLARVGAEGLDECLSITIALLVNSLFRYCFGEGGMGGEETYMTHSPRRNARAINDIRTRLRVHTPAKRYLPLNSSTHLSRWNKRGVGGRTTSAGEDLRCRKRGATCEPFTRPSVWYC